MKRSRKTYNPFQLMSAIFMILTLLWITVSIPFVTTIQQELAKQNKVEKAESPLINGEEEANPPGNTTEEKPPGNVSISEEYLHENFLADHFFSTVTPNYKCENAGTYIAFYGELLAPPPDAANINPFP